MGELFWNKVAGAVIGLVLVVMLIGWVTEELYHTEIDSESFAYPVDMAALQGSDGPEAPVVVYDLGLLLANASASAGERVARRCTSCHTLEPGGGALQGPNLYDIVGRASAADSGFSYSSAMADYGLPWTYENLDHFIANPRAEVSGTAMSFAGIRNDEDRANLLAYLASLSSDPVAFPDPLPPVEDEMAEDTMVDGDAVMEDAGEVVLEPGQTRTLVNSDELPTSEDPTDSPLDDTSADDAPSDDSGTDE